jgi:competence protein ComEC
VTLLVLAAARFPRLPLSPEPVPRSRRFFHYIFILFLTSLVAAAGTTPIAAYHFQRLTFTGPAANILAVPLTGFVVLPLGLASLLGDAIWTPLGALLARPAEAAAEILLSLARFFAGFSWSSVAIPRPPPLLVASLLALGAALLFRPAGKGGRIAAAALAGLTIVTALWWGGRLVSPQMRVHFFDVGQGEATLVRLPGGGTILVDTGPAWEHADAGRYIVAPGLRKLGVSRVDILVLTHLHPDHSGGLLSILEEFPVGEIWTTACEGEECPSEVIDRLRRWEGEGGKLMLPVRGYARENGSGVEIKVLNPPAEPYRAGGVHQARNDNSLVLFLAWKGFRLLMTGDIGAAPVRDIAALIPPGEEGGVVKVPHHGGRQEGTPLLTAAFRPALAVISVGRNRYGHPNDRTSAVYAREGRLLRTDRDGGISIRSDGGSLEVRTWKELAGRRSWAERVRWLFEGS